MENFSSAHITEPQCNHGIRTKHCGNWREGWGNGNPEKSMEKLFELHLMCAYFLKLYLCVYIFVYLCVYPVYICVQVDVCTCVCMWNVECLPYHSPPYCLSQSLLLNLKPSDSAQLTCQWAPEMVILCLSIPSAEVKMHGTTPALHGSWGFILGSSYLGSRHCTISSVERTLGSWDFKFLHIFLIKM